MKGFVYLFRQKGTNYIKIGMTNGETVKSRFNMFKMYSPLGAEIIHIIESNNARILEKELHTKFKEKRLKGEFFLLSDEDIAEIICIENLRIEKLKVLFWDFVLNNDLDLEVLEKKLYRSKNEKTNIDELLILSEIEKQFSGKEVTNSEILYYMKSIGIEIESNKKLGMIISSKYNSIVKFISGKSKRIYSFPVVNVTDVTDCYRTITEQN